METTITKLRRRILDVAYRDGMGHIPSALSILDIVWTLYDKVMTKDDQFILSKGHGVMALYAVLEEKGLFDWSTKAMGHPKRGGAILASTGSLGHGLPMAVGLALAKKIKGENGRVFCLVGDGECNEGTTWESAMIAAHHKLDNLVLIVDQNHSSDRALDTGDLGMKFVSFGFCTDRVLGHNEKEIESDLYIAEPEHCKDSPHAVIAETIKANGVPFMQENSWHNRKMSESEYNEAIKL
jgi:transketolase